MDGSADDSQSTGSAKSKSFGDTTVEPGASAHLGDVSNDLNIHGGLHLHFASPLETIALAGRVTELLDVSNKLLQLGSWLEEPTTESSHQDVTKLVALLKSLSSIVSRLYSPQDAAFNSTRASAQNKVIDNFSKGEMILILLGSPRSGRITPRKRSRSP